MSSVCQQKQFFLQNKCLSANKNNRSTLKQISFYCQKFLNIIVNYSCILTTESVNYCSYFERASWEKVFSLLPCLFEKFKYRRLYLKNTLKVLIFYFYHEYTKWLLNKTFLLSYLWDYDYTSSWICVFDT